MLICTQKSEHSNCEIYSQSGVFFGISCYFILAVGRPAQNTCIDLPHGTDLNFGGVMTGRWVGRWMNVHEMLLDIWRSSIWYLTNISHSHFAGCHLSSVKKLGGGYTYCLFSSLFGEDEPNLTFIFFRWVETTNQKNLRRFCSSCHVEMLSPSSKEARLETLEIGDL